MKKIITLMILLVIMVFTNNVKVSAAETTLKQQYLNYYHAHKNGNSYSKYGQIASWTDNITGEKAYCISPGDSFSSSAKYTTYGILNDNILNIINGSQTWKLTQEQLNDISLIAYYGYGYNDHNSIEYLLATQMLIWRVIDSQQVFTNVNCTSGSCHSISDEQVGVADEMSNIQNLIDKHYVYPSFDSESRNINVGEKTTFVDEFEVLNDYVIEKCENCTAEISNNKLILTPTNSGAFKVNLQKKSNKYSANLVFATSSTSQNQVIRGNLDPLSASVKGNVIGGTLNITKLDKNTFSPLSNSTFEVYNSNNNLVCTIVTNSLGKGECTNLNLGDYYIKETNSPIGYILDEKNYNFTISSITPTVELSFFNEKIRGSIQLNKIDSETQFVQGDGTLENAIYGLYSENGNLISTLKTNKNGYAFLEGLEYGNYYLQEIESSEGYDLDSQKYNFSILHNNEIIKIISEEPIKKFEFKILKTMSDGSSGLVATESNAEFNIYLKSNNQLISTITTNEEGRAKIELPFGIYNVCQTKGNGFTLLADCFEINLKEDNVEKIVNNQYIESKLKVIKVDQLDTPIKLSGIKFKIKNLDTNSYICQTTDKKICEYVTNDEGIMITPLPLTAGHYQLEEVNQKIEGYLWNKDALSFTIDENSNIINDYEYGHIIELKFINQEVLGSIIINKFGEEMNIKNNEIYYIEKKLDGIEFQLYDSFNELIDTIITDENGYARIDNLKLGTYFIKEIKTKEGYVLDDKMYEIDLSYKDQNTPYVEVLFKTYNFLKKGTLEFNKVDSITGDSVPNAVIEIFNDKDELVFTGKTNELGKIIVGNLEVGKYYIVEKEAPEGYFLNNEIIRFEILEDGEIVKTTMNEEKIEIELPSTFKNDYLIFISLGIILSGIGIASYEVIKNKRDK